MSRDSGEAASAGGRAPERLWLLVYGLVFFVNLTGGALIFLYLTVIDVSSLERLRFIRSWETSDDRLKGVATILTRLVRLAEAEQEAA